jgi:hypothetical protein
MPKSWRGGRERMANEENRPPKKPYEKPTATKLTREQAKLKLMGHAMMGSKEAKELLDMSFENKKQNKNETEHKKSA